MYVKLFYKTQYVVKHYVTSKDKYTELTNELTSCGKYWRYNGKRKFAQHFNDFYVNFMNEKFIIPDEEIHLRFLYNFLINIVTGLILSLLIFNTVYFNH